MAMRVARCEGAAQAIAETLAPLPPDWTARLDVESLWLSENPSEGIVRDFLVNPERRDEFLAYVLLARALRRADQAGTMMGSS